MRVLHLTTVRVLYGGQRRQLEFEVRAANEGNLSWDTVALHVDPPENEFERQIPRVYRNRVLLRVYGWVMAIRLGRNYDFVLLRDMQLDVLGPLLSRFVKPWATVHHAKEIEELSILRGGGWASRVAVFLERFVKPLTMRAAWGLAGVTGEIRDYEVSRFPWLRDRTLVYPNGYILNEAVELDHQRDSAVMTYAFVCAEFTAWHGLERLVSAIDTGKVADGDLLRFHLVGHLTEQQHQLLNAVTRDDVEIIRYGRVHPSEVANILAQCDVAIGSLALDKQGLSEGSTLKVREYLASGLPVYATHKDAALPDAFPYFFNDKEGPSVERLAAFTRAVREVRRSDVREASKPFINKVETMRTVMARIAEIRHDDG